MRGGQKYLVFCTAPMGTSVFSSDRIALLKRDRVFEHAIPLTEGKAQGKHCSNNLRIRYDHTGLEIRLGEEVVLRAFQARGLANYPRIDTPYGVFEVNRCSLSHEWRDRLKHAYEKFEEQGILTSGRS